MWCIWCILVRMVTGSYGSQEEEAGFQRISGLPPLDSARFQKRLPVDSLAGFPAILRATARPPPFLRVHKHPRPGFRIGSGVWYGMVQVPVWCIVQHHNPAYYGHSGNAKVRVKFWTGRRPSSRPKYTPNFMVRAFAPLSKTDSSSTMALCIYNRET